MTNDPFAAVRAAHTAAGNYDLDTTAIIQRLEQWKQLCSFDVTSAKGDRIDIVFQTLPDDMDAFANDVYKFCPDLVSQGTGCIRDMVESMDPGELPPKIQQLIEGLDFSTDDHGVEILKRELQNRKSVTLWWD